MSETAPLNTIDQPAPATQTRVPTIYFIDDSATMREVIKIAFRKENMQVVTCPDAASALAQFAENPPDAVITDVIMPDKDGYEVCDYVKQHEAFGKTPVVLMSGVVNKTVAEKAMSVKADELIRKPFHPQDLIGRVKGLLAAKFPSQGPPAVVAEPAAQSAPPIASPPPAAHSFVEKPRTLSNFFASGPVHNPLSAPGAEARALNPKPKAPLPNFPPNAGAPAEVQKLRNDVRRLELLVKKLEAELEAAKQYAASLEAHINTMEQ